MCNPFAAGDEELAAASDFLWPRGRPRPLCDSVADVGAANYVCDADAKLKAQQLSAIVDDIDTDE